MGSSRICRSCCGSPIAVSSYGSLEDDALSGMVVNVCGRFGLHGNPFGSRRNSTLLWIFCSLECWFEVEADNGSVFGDDLERWEDTGAEGVMPFGALGGTELDMVVVAVVSLFALLLSIYRQENGLS